MQTPKTKIAIHQYRDLLGQYLLPQWRRVVVLGVLLFSTTGLQLVDPQILRHFIDSAGEGMELTGLLGIALLFAGVAIAQQGVSVLATYFSQTVAWTATNAMRSSLVRHCLHLDMSFHNDHTPGEMIERVDGDVNTLSGFLSGFVINVLGSILLLIGVLVLLFREDWRIGLVLAVFAALSLTVLVRLRDLAVPHWKASSEARADVFGFLEERLSGTEDIRSLDARHYVMRRFFEASRKWYSRLLRASLMSQLFSTTNYLQWAAGNAIGLALAAYLFLDGVITIGTAYLIYHYSSLLYTPIERFAYELRGLQRAGGSIARILELTESRPVVQDGRGDELPSEALSVEFEDVSFAYNDKAPVLDRVNFQIEPGRVLGLLGRTGAGKTTITRLIFRLYDPDSGRVRLGGTDLRDTTKAHLREHVGMVTQSVRLFHGTVRQNLTFFDDSVSDDRLLAVIEDLGLTRWYRGLSEGLDTMLAPDGEGLSAGEAQLLAFARVFLTDPGLVILDEASSRLDRATERLIERAVDRLVEGRTVIVIAHRLGTVERADEIMVLDEGRIVEHGERRRLAVDPSSRLYGILRTGLEGTLA